MPATPVDIKTTATRKKPGSRKKPPSKTAGKPPRQPPATDES